MNGIEFLRTFSHMQTIEPLLESLFQAPCSGLGSSLTFSLHQFIVCKARGTGSIKSLFVKQGL